MPIDPSVRDVVNDIMAKMQHTLPSTYKQSERTHIYYDKNSRYQLKTNAEYKALLDQGRIVAVKTINGISCDDIDALHAMAIYYRLIAPHFEKYMNELGERASVIQQLIEDITYAENRMTSTIAAHLYRQGWRK